MSNQLRLQELEQRIPQMEEIDVALIPTVELRNLETAVEEMCVMFADIIEADQNGWYGDAAKRVAANTASYVVSDVAKSALDYVGDYAEQRIGNKTFNKTSNAFLSVVKAGIDLYGYYSMGKDGYNSWKEYSEINRMRDAEGRAREFLARIKTELRRR